MTPPFWVTAIVFVVLTCVGYLATRLAEFATRALPSYRSVPVVWEPAWWFSVVLSLAMGAIGTATFARGATPFGLVFVTVLLVALTFACYADVRVGRIPAVIMIPAIALGVLSDALTGDWLPLVAAAVVVAPFAIAAFASKSRGMSWSDLQLVALGALALDVSSGLLAFALACFLAVGVAFARGRANAPIAFAPYLMATIELALLLPTAIR